MANQQFDERGLFLVDQSFDSTYTPGTDLFLFGQYSGTERFDAWVVWSTDTVAHKLTIKLPLAASQPSQTVITIPAADPNNLPVVVDLLSKLFPVGGASYVTTGYHGNITVALDAAPSANTYISVLLMGGQL